MIPPLVERFVNIPFVASWRQNREEKRQVKVARKMEVIRRFRSIGATIAEDLDAVAQLGIVDTLEREFFVTQLQNHLFHRLYQVLHPSVLDFFKPYMSKEEQLTLPLPTTIRRTDSLQYVLEITARDLAYAVVADADESILVERLIRFVQTPQEETYQRRRIFEPSDRLREHLAITFPNQGRDIVEGRKMSEARSRAI